MILSLIGGLILGALAVIFALQNVAVITVTFLSWQITGPLAFILLGTLVSGGVVTLLVLLPSVIRDEMLFSVVKAERDELNKEVIRLKTALNNNSSSVVVPATNVIL